MKIQDGRISSPFGERKNPFTGEPQIHTGIDIVYGNSEIYAGLDGVVTRAEFGKYGEGNFIQTISRFDAMVFFSNYMHLAKFHVKPGDKVEPDNYLGEMGVTGNTTGPHLHYEIFITENLMRLKYYYKIKDIKKYHIGKRIFFEPFELIKRLYWG